MVAKRTLYYDTDEFSVCLIEEGELYRAIHDENIFTYIADDGSIDKFDDMESLLTNFDILRITNEYDVNITPTDRASLRFLHSSKEMISC